MPRRSSAPPILGLPDGKDTKTGMAFIPGGSFVMGSDRQQPEERSTRFVRVDGFWIDRIDRHEVTNAQFARFVAATGYVTLAERGLDPQDPSWHQARTCLRPAPHCSCSR